MNAEATGKNGKVPSSTSNGGAPSTGASSTVGAPAAAADAKTAADVGANVGANTSTVMQITGSLDRGLDHIDRALASGVDLQLDLSDCNFITVDGLEWLEELLLRAESLRSQVRIVKIQPTVYKVFKVAHIGSILKACDSPAPRGPVC